MIRPSNETRRVEAVRAAAWLSKQLEVTLAEHGLSLPQYRLLTVLETGGEAAASALADWLAVRPPSVTALVDGLVHRGLVERHHADDDRRRVLHLLTPAGLEAVNEADTALAGKLDDLGSHLDPTDQSAAHHGLRLWQQAMQAAWDVSPVGGNSR